VDFISQTLPSRVVFGAGRARTHLGDEVRALGLSRVMLIAAESELPLARELVAPFAELIAVEFTGVRPHVPSDVADAARAAAADGDADGLLCVGGGSTTGTAKIVALTTGLPILAVPTTYAGSEMTPVWGLTTAARKETGNDPRVLPKTVVYDPDLTRTLPASLAAASAFNAIAHCVEAFWGPGANPINSLSAAEGIRALRVGLDGLADGAVDPVGDEAYDLLLYGTALAGSAFAVAGSGLHHKICHALGGAFDLPHAQTHTVVLPHVLAFNEGTIGDDALRISEALGGGTPSVALRALEDRLDAPKTLQELGLRADQLDEAIDIVSAKLPIANPREVTREHIAHILRAAFTGEV
jgi:alcohol dehydrogenase class IV